jgi:hypothetical protein
MRIGKTCFRYKDSNFRLSGFYFIYRLSDGEKLFAHCEPQDANGVGGSGICGVITELSQIEILDTETQWDEELLLEKQNSNKRSIENDLMRFSWLKFLSKLKPSGTMSRKTYDLLAENKFMSSLGLNQHSPPPWK